MSRDVKMVDEKKSTGAPAPGQRWSVARKREVVMLLLRGEALRGAVDDFDARDNAHWRLQKNGLRSPDEVRADFDAARLATAA